MIVRHEVTEPWRSHFGNVLRQIAAAESEVAVLRGRIALLEKAIEDDRREAGHLVALLAAAERLPAAEGAYSLSADGRYLVGRTKDEDAELPLPPPRE